MTALAFALAASFAAFGIALTAMPVAQAWRLLGLHLIALSLALVFPGVLAEGEVAVLALWAATILAALLAHLGAKAPLGIWRAVALISGGVAGAAISASPSLILGASLPLVLLFLPAGKLIIGLRRLAIQISASWLIAIGLIGGAVTLVPPSGPVGDHAE